MRRHPPAIRRIGFTLIEILVAVGILSALAAVVIAAVSPRKAILAARDTERSLHALAVRNALMQYAISNGVWPADGIPGSAEQAVQICAEGVTENSSCSQLDALVPDYIARIPRDIVEPCSDFTGYLVHTDVDFASVTPLHQGKLPGDDVTASPGCGDSSSSSSSAPSSAASSAASSQPTDQAELDDSGNLIVYGTLGNDSVTVNTSIASSVSVSINGHAAAGSPFNMSAYPTARVVVSVLDGGDTVLVLGSRQVEIRGGPGNDFLYGGNGDDILLGEDGNDYISGGAGHDAMIGGLGMDTLSGGANRDFLVGGDLSADDYDDLEAARQEWVLSQDENAAPIEALFVVLIDDDTASEDDALSGGGDMDMFFHRVSSGPGDDTVSDFGAGDKERTL